MAQAFRKTGDEHHHCKKSYSPVLIKFSAPLSDAFPEPCQASKKELFPKSVKGL